MMERCKGSRAWAGAMAAMLALAGMVPECRAQRPRGVAPRYGEGVLPPPRASRTPRRRVRAVRPPTLSLTEMFNPFSPRATARYYARSRQEVSRNQRVAARIAERALPAQHAYLQAWGLPGSTYLRMDQPVAGGPWIPVGYYWPGTYPKTWMPYGAW